MVKNCKQFAKILKDLLKHVDIYSTRLVQNKDDKMDYENELELCEYNPISVKYEQELKALAQVVEAPAMSFFQRMMKKIILSHTVEA